MKCHNTNCTKECDRYVMAACIDRTNEEQEALKSILRAQNVWIGGSVWRSGKKVATALINTLSGDIYIDGQYKQTAHIRG